MKKIIEGLIIILYLGIITGIIPILLFLFMENYTILYIPMSLVSIYWISKSIKDYFYEEGE